MPEGEYYGAQFSAGFSPNGERLMFTKRKSKRGHLGQEDQGFQEERSSGGITFVLGISLRAEDLSLGSAPIFLTW